MPRESWKQRARGELLLLVVEEKFRETAGPLSIGGILEGEGDG